MPSNYILLPVLAQVLLTLALYFALVIAKTRAAKRGEIDRARTALDDDAWPDSVRKINNNIRNQFQVPVLFYVVTFIHWVQGSVGSIVLSLAWVFVASRIAHAYVHTTSNTVPVRRAVFTFGFIVLIALTVFAVIAVLRA